MDSRIPIQGYTPSELVRLVPNLDELTARKVISQVFQRAQDILGVSVPKMGRRTSVDAIAARFRVGRLEVIEREHSRLDPFVKYLLACEDGARIETVRIPLEKPGRFVVCVSSQVGCALGCAFCATGRMGLSRNLEAWEIVEQVRLVRRELPEGSRVHGVVFQGMGEPLANVERVIAALSVMHDPSALAINQRNITVCTVGIPSGIRRLRESGIRVRLGISVSSARSEVRRRLVPIERQNPLAEVMEEVVEFVRRHGDAPMFAITPLSGVNTSAEDADALAKLVSDFKEKTGVSPRLSVVAYNSLGANDPFARATELEDHSFRDRLKAIGVPVVRRYSGGGDVGAACGQLAGKVTELEDGT